MSSASGTTPDAPPRRSLTRTALLLLPVQAVFRGGEAILPLLLATWFGRSPETDAYFLAWAFFTFVGGLLSAAFQDSALVPIVTEVATATPEELPEVAGSLLVHILRYGSAVAAAMGVAALIWFRVQGPPELFPFAASLVPPLVLYVVALSLRSFFVGFLNARGWYVAHPIGSGLGVGASLALLFAFRHQVGVRLVPWASLLAEVVAVAVLTWIAVRGVGLRLRLTSRRPEPVARFFRLVASEVGGSALTRINPVVDQVMASMAAVVGGGTLVRYATDVAALPTSIVQATVLPVLLSHLSLDVAARSLPAFTLTVRRALLVVCALLVSMTVGLELFLEPVLRLVFLHGEMDAAGVAVLAEVTRYALLGVAPFGALLILARAHVALQNSRIMFSMGILNAGSKLVLSLALFPLLGLRGLALGTSAMNLVVAVVFWVRLRARLRRPF